MNPLEKSYQQDVDGLIQELRRQFNRARNSSADDVNLLAIDLFASLVMQHDDSIALEATKIIADNLKSTNSNEILQTLNVLEECMSKCGPRFHSEVGKFRFLNELIRLVSYQYLGTQTVPKVRNKILDLLLLWTIQYPKESKIKEAYDMLLSRGVKHDNTKTIQIQNKPNINEQITKQRDEVADKLKELLQSSNPSDHKAANLLIQNMVKEKERRTEIRVRRKLEVREMVENATLLKEMLEQYNDDVPCEDTLATIVDLHSTCESLKGTLLIWTGETNDSELLDETLQAIELMTEAFQKYEDVVVKRTKSKDQLLLSGLNVNVNSSAPSSSNAIDELQEIFTKQAALSTASNTLNTLPLEPQKMVIDSAIANNAQGTSHTDETGFNSLSDSVASSLPILLPSLLKDFSAIQTSTPSEKSGEPSPSKMPTGRSKFDNLDTEMTQFVSKLKFDLLKDQSSATDSASCQPDLLLCDNTLEDDIMLEHSNDESIGSKLNNLEPSLEILCDNVGEVPIPVDLSDDARKPLSEINVDINSIMPHKTLAPRVLLEEEKGLKITLNFSRDRPRKDVTVLVIITTNHNSQPISNYQFEASVSRPCKLRLQSASGSELPGVKPFRLPSEDITQIMLLSNAERKPFKLVCIISYLMGDDPDPIKESFEISDLPYILD